MYLLRRSGHWATQRRPIRLFKQQSVLLHSNAHTTTILPEKDTCPIQVLFYTYYQGCRKGFWATLLICTRGPKMKITQESQGFCWAPCLSRALSLILMSPVTVPLQQHFIRAEPLRHSCTIANASDSPSVGFVPIPPKERSSFNCFN